MSEKWYVIIATSKDWCKHLKHRMAVKALSEDDALQKYLKESGHAVDSHVTHGPFNEMPTENTMMGL